LNYYNELLTKISFVNSHNKDELHNVFTNVLNLLKKYKWNDSKQEAKAEIDQLLKNSKINNKGFVKFEIDCIVNQHFDIG